MASDILKAVRALMIAAVLLTSCANAPPPLERPKPEPTTEPWYGETTRKLAEIDRQAESLFRSGSVQQAAARITQGQPLARQLLSVPRPTLAAMEAASDLDQLYGRMLFTNGHYGWARLQFQKNVARWKNWRPQTPDTARRLQLALSAIAECDQRLAH